MALKFLAQGMKSLSLKHVDSLVRDLVKELRRLRKQEPADGYTSENLRQYFVEQNIYLPEKYYDRGIFSIQPPDVTVTYMWPGTPIEQLAQLLRCRLQDDDKIYLDIFLNDQRTGQAITMAVANANVLYMHSPRHVIIISAVEYPTFNDAEVENGKIFCWIFDRCWCVLEMAIRDCLSVQKLSHQESAILIVGKFAEQLAERVKPGETSITDIIANEFRGIDFFERLQGRPSDVRQIKETLISPGFFSSTSHFNEYYRKRMTRLFVENIQQVISSKRLKLQNIDLSDILVSFCSIPMIPWIGSKSVFKA